MGISFCCNYVFDYSTATGVGTGVLLLLFSRSLMKCFILF